MTRRAIILDLDNTLYPERRFALSGYAALARHIESERGVPSRLVFGSLSSSFRRGRRATALQELCARFAWDESVVPEWVAFYRAHRPSLRLPVASRTLLSALRPHWRVGVLTNGLPSVQASKVEALGLERLVDVVVYAEQHGDGRGKPDPQTFDVAAELLGVRNERSVFVGDDPVRDIAGAAVAGMRTVLACCQPPSRSLSPRQARAVGADAVVWSLGEIPAVASRLLEGERAHVH